jgi:hypothetical protein
MHQYNVGAPFERTAIDVAGPFPRSYQGNHYLLIALDYFTKWPEAYTIPHQEASIAADVLVTNFTMPGSEQDVYHTPAPTAGRHGGNVYENGRRGLAEGRLIQIQP